MIRIGALRVSSSRMIRPTIGVLMIRIGVLRVYSSRMIIRSLRHSGIQCPHMISQSPVTSL